MHRLIIATPIALACLAAAPVMASDITLTGTGTVRAAPDMATINTGVTTQAQTAREALDANTEAMGALIAALREAGLDDDDIQTTDFTVSPQYVYSDGRDDNGYSLPPRIEGYQVSNAVTIAVHDLDNLGAVLDRAVSVGANTVNGISFSVEDPAELYRKARGLAFEDAHDKALTYAEAAGVRLGDLEEIREMPMNNGPQPMMRAMAMDVAVAQSAPVPVEAGNLTFTVTATVSWDIRD